MYIDKFRWPKDERINVPVARATASSILETILFASHT